MQVRISKPAKSSMQSPDTHHKWVLEFIKIPNSRYIDSIGRTSSKDISNQVRLFFDTLEEAENFAKRKHYLYEIIKPNIAKVAKKNYSSNFL